MGEQICIIDVQLTNQQQLHDAIMPIWRKISEECFQQLLLSAKWVQPLNVDLMKNVTVAACLSETEIFS